MVKEEQRETIHEKYRKKETKWHTNPSTSISIITLEMNGFHKAIPKQRLSKWRKSRSNCMLSSGNTLFLIQRHNSFKAKLWKRYANIILFNIVLEVFGNQARKRNKNHSDWKRRSKAISIQN